MAGAGRLPGKVRRTLGSLILLIAGRFQGRSGLVTGAGSGIGEACAIRFAEEGAEVALVDRAEDSLERVAATIAERGGRASIHALNVADGEACVELIPRIAADLGGLDFAANIAGIGGELSPTQEYQLDSWRQVLAVNLDGVFYCLRAELSVMLAAGRGAIVNMGSIFSVVARDLMPAYTASKHGVLGLTRAAAIDCAETDVRINAVGPGVIATPLLETSVPVDEQERLASLNPSKRLGSTDEVASLVTWLCSDEASFVNGGFYPVDGAFTAA